MFATRTVERDRWHRLGQDQCRPVNVKRSGVISGVDVE